MRIHATVQAVVVGLLVSACAHTPVFDSCSHPRPFRQFDWPSRSYYSLPDRDPSALGEPVHKAVRRYMQSIGGDEVRILAAKESGAYLLLTARGPCFDCDRWLVYSPRRQCVVGTFALALQGG